PPFQLTSPTVLCQVLSVVERCYRGDGLRYLIHFLLPAKNFLQNLQQDACVQHCGLLFRHEGWPLCVHEKIVVQLCPLDQRLLRPGDFYLLVSPAAAPPPRSKGASCRSGQQEVSQLALRSLFSMAWLDSVNRERERRGAPRLEHCLLAAHGDVFRVPWEDLVYPQFISRPRPAARGHEEHTAKDAGVLINTSHNLHGDTNSSGQDRKLLQHGTQTGQSAASSEDEDSEGEYVELTELPRFSPQKGSLTQSISLQHRARTACCHLFCGSLPGSIKVEFKHRKHPLVALSTSFWCRDQCCVSVVCLLWVRFSSSNHPVCCRPPGSTDRAGRALLTVSCCCSVWSEPDYDSAELLRLLLYYISTLRYKAPPPPRVAQVTFWL
uniref:Uncharacterized protein n=1 Tax=Stegastes partitus TaxID=144197 RepID=A0A3B5BA39_9TELE